MITREDFGAWRSHPGTKEIFKFLLAYQAKMGLAWARGEELTAKQQALATAYGELAGLEYDELQQFYGVDDDERAA